MKKIRLASVFILGCALLSFQSFAQNQQVTQGQNTIQPSSKPILPVNNGKQFNQRAIPNNIGSTNVNATFQQSSSHQTPAGQHTCKTFELNQKHYQERGIQQEFNQGYLNSAQAMANYYTPKTPGVNEISIIFHVVHNPNNPSENVSNALIMQVYDDIMEDFQALNLGPVRSGFGFTPADANIRFCLATQTPAGVPLAELGVVRVSTTEDWYDSDNGEENKMKASATGGSQIWNRNNYLNVWICDISNGAGSGTAGYAYRPNASFLPGANIDGIVLDYNLGMNNENILTHEVGHYLGLDHTWGGSGGCGVDDGFADTPVTDGPSFNYPGSCSASQQTCAGTQTQFENFMDYSNCTSMFTQQQANYMLTILQGIRGSLLLSPGCNPTNTPPNSAFTSSPAGPAPVVIPQNASVSFIDQSTNVATAWAWTISGTQGVDWAWINSTNQNSQDPVAEFYTVGTYNVTLTASNAFGADATPAIENMYVQVAAIASGNSCDTLRNYIPTDDFYYFTTTNGYVPGHCTPGGYQALGWAEKYNATSTTKVKAVEFLTYQISDGGGNVTIKVYNDNGGIPGTTVATEVVPLSDLSSLTWENVAFTTPATVTGTFWVGFELSYANPTDTFSLFTNVDQNLPITYTYSNLNSIGWLDLGTAFNPDYKLAYVMDVLTSNGTDPVADFNTSSWEVCEDGDIQVDGSISTNTNSYQWYVTDDPVTTILESSTSSSNTFNFPYSPGDYSVYLFANSSCVSDGIVMPVTIFSDIAATVTPTATTCGNNNGIITITSPTGGGSTNYYYSLDGVNYQTSNVFNNLAPGSYTVSIGSLDDVTGNSLGSGCISTYTVNVGTSSPISPTVSANASVCPGGSATITAGGGTGYSWYNGASLIASSASTSVTPATTTQYSCVVTSGACSATVYTTVTVRTPPTAPTITPSSSTTICAGGSVTLTSSYASGNTWSANTGSATTQQVNATASGNYTVTYVDGNGCSSTSAITAVTVNPLPVITQGTLTSPTTCGTATGSIQVNGTGTGNVSWTGTATGSATGVTLPYTIPSLAAGSYNITYTTGGCTSSQLNVALNDPTPPATPTISVTGALTFCAGGSVLLTSSQATGIVWSANTGSATTQQITATASGNYTVTYTNVSGCSATSAATVVTVNPLPTVTQSALGTVCVYNPSMVLTGGLPTGGTYSGTGVTAGNFNPATAGNGTHTITYTYEDGNNCVNTATADIVVDGCLSINESDLTNVKVYPNPTELNLTIEVSGDFNYEILDTKGRIIEKGNGNNSVVVSTVEYTSGVYFVSLKSETINTTIRVVKN